MKTIQQLRDLRVSTEEHRRVPLGERLQSRERRPIRVPDRTSEQRQPFLCPVLPNHHPNNQQHDDAG
jgi:hypothetical protein